MVSNNVVRPAQPDDVLGILLLMRELARFEGYEKEFRVTEKAIFSGLFEENKFEVLVATRGENLAGILTYYYLPFTYDLTPWIYIKELYVSAGFRSKGIGRMLMNELVEECKRNGGTKIRWDVLSDNHAAKKFYVSLGAHHDKKWEIFYLGKNE